MTTPQTARMMALVAAAQARIRQEEEAKAQAKAATTEVHDIIDINPDGTIASVTTESLRTREVRVDAGVVPPKQTRRAATVKSRTSIRKPAKSAKASTWCKGADMDNIEQEIQAKGLTAPRITPADIEANIAEERYFTATDGCLGDWQYRHDTEGAEATGAMQQVPAPLHLLTFCVL